MICKNHFSSSKTHHPAPQAQGSVFCEGENLKIFSLQKKQSEGRSLFAKAFAPQISFDLLLSQKQQFPRSYKSKMLWHIYC